MIKPIDIGKIIPDVGKILNDSITTDEERMDGVERRHAVDSAAEAWLPRAIRPLLSLAYTGLHIFLTVKALYMGLLDITTALLSTAVIVGAIIGFYFTGRTKIKAIDIQSKAAIKITELKLKQSLSEERKDNRLRRFLERKNTK